MKYYYIASYDDVATSPSMRRVWIEINIKLKEEINMIVTLHAEGVD